VCFDPCFVRRLYLLTAEATLDRLLLDQLGAERTFLHIAGSYSVFFNSGPVRRCNERQNEPEWAQENTKYEPSAATPTLIGGYHCADETEEEPGENQHGMTRRREEWESGGLLKCFKFPGTMI
jgi:hypothetical protein